MARAAGVRRALPLPLAAAAAAAGAADLRDVAGHSPDIVDYYLGLLPGVISIHARKRLFLVTPLDGSTGL